MTGPIAASYYATPAALSQGDGSVEVWLTDPPGILTRTHGTIFRASTATFLARDADLFLRQSVGGPYLFVHDFSSLRGYDSGAREIMTDWGRALGPRLKKARVCIADDAPRLVRMGVSVVCAGLVVAGFDMRLAPNAESALRELGVRAKGAR